jgi:hypothetical protein
VASRGVLPGGSGVAAWWLIKVGPPVADFLVGFWVQIARLVVVADEGGVRSLLSPLEWRFCDDDVAAGFEGPVIRFGCDEPGIVLLTMRVLVLYGLQSSWLAVCLARGWVSAVCLV